MSLVVTPTGATDVVAYEKFQVDLADALSEGVASIGPVRLAEIDRRGEGHSWETYIVVAQWDDATGRTREATFAVKREPAGGIAGPYDVGREVALLDAAARAGCPVPRVVAHRIGRGGQLGFFAMERLDGTIPMPHTVTRIITDPERRAALGRDVARVMARLHAAPLDTVAVPALQFAPSAEDTGAAENSKWTAVYDAVARLRVPVLDLALAWLEARSSSVSGRVSLVHNDLRVGNLVVDSTGALVGVLDWETAHYSDPAADIAWFAQPVYRGRSPLAGKLIALDDFLDTYEAEAGWRPDARTLAWWSVQSLTKTAIGCLQAVQVYSSGVRPDLRYAVMARSVTFSLRYLTDMLRTGEWGQ
jgi:aminoglycoside phosphotransferase (APT) family kinase protein